MIERWRNSESGRSARLPRLGLAGALVLALAAIAQACNVPVFRYALEHWSPDPYQVTLFHRGALADAERAFLQPLLEEIDQSRINVALRTIDVSELTDDADRKLFERHDKLPLPGLVVRYPKHLRIEESVKSVALSLEAVAGLMKSPVRSELIHRLADGQTAVWLFLESGEREADNTMATRLEGELRALEQKLKLPELTDAPEDVLLTGAPLRVAFSLLRVPRGDSAEAALVAMLLGSEPDLAERTDAMLFPVFGRGRALLPLVGPGITAENIQSSASFLTGPCSCQVKDQNPGFDLLLAAEWETLLATGESPLKDIPPLPDVSTSEPELVAIPSGAPAASASAQSASAPSATAPAEALDRVAIQQPTSTVRTRNVPQVIAGVVLLAAAGCIGMARAFRTPRQP